MLKTSQIKKEKILVGFAAETENIVDNALKKMKEKRLDLIVANDVTKKGIGFDSEYNQVSIVDQEGKVLQTEKMSKRQISQIIMDKIEDIIGRKRKEAHK